ncbi:hypothetical protein [Streptomyces sp. NBC_01373]|uniref:hypothetical protein n=1 Tax=Streptomyces sp. NBC_01373 TaxID=2903843 RepID=UPI00225BF834|nr:hypothetical protein [Streptomyces sp. NBC_01373]MCX4706791.1 hypothetical protein [Streptomyces sp. NBC_01373]
MLLAALPVALAGTQLVAGAAFGLTSRNLQRTAKPVSEALVSIVAVLDGPPPRPLSAFVEEYELDVHAADFGPSAARRLHDLTEEYLAAH